MINRILIRIFDLLISFCGLIVLSPILFLIPFLIVVDSRGPILFKQLRVGKDNKDFNLYKFRTMKPKSDRFGLISIGKIDPRVTRVGYYLRKYKLDELPQLFNVLRGDMSLVGPRPEVRKYVDLYTPDQRHVLTVRPGITDYASITYAEESILLAASSDPEQFYISRIMPEKIRLNQRFLKNNNIATYFKIIINTIVRIIVNPKK